MSVEVNETASEALRQLAEWVVREDVNSGRLEQYMGELLSQRLIELHAVCRFEAIQLARGNSEMGSSDVGAWLCQVAGELERKAVAVGIMRDHDFTPIEAEAGPATCRLEFNPGQRRRASDQRRLSWLPECIAGVAFISIAICLMRGGSGDFRLRSLACSSCALIGICHGGVAIYSLWQNARNNKADPSKRASAGA